MDHGASRKEPISTTTCFSEPAAIHDGGFQRILNFRDVALTVNTHLQTKLLREGVFFRSARPDGATLSDRALLKSRYNVHTIMDLRTKTEHVQAAKKRAVEAKIPAKLEANDAITKPVKIDGIRYRDVRITGSGFERHMLAQLGWWDLA